MRGFDIGFTLITDSIGYLYDISLNMCEAIARQVMSKVYMNSSRKNTAKYVNITGESKPHQQIDTFRFDK